MGRGEDVEGGRNSVNRGRMDSPSPKQRWLWSLFPLPLVGIVPVSVLETLSP